MCEMQMRTCKTCGETKPLQGNFRVAKIYETAEGLKTSYYYSCIVCKNYAQNQKQKKQRAADREAAHQSREWAQADVSASIRAAREACPILGLGLWTNQAAAR